MRWPLSTLHLVEKCICCFSCGATHPWIELQGGHSLRNQKIIKGEMSCDYNVMMHRARMGAMISQVLNIPK